MTNHGLAAGQRVAIYLPNDARAATWIAAAKRLGAPYVAVASGSASSSLADRLSDTRAAALLTIEAAAADIRAAHGDDHPHTHKFTAALAELRQ